MKNIRFSEKLSSISMFSVFLNSLDIKYTQKYKGEEKKHMQWQRTVLLSWTILSCQTLATFWLNNYTKDELFSSK